MLRECGQRELIRIGLVRFGRGETIPALTYKLSEPCRQPSTPFSNWCEFWKHTDIRTTPRMRKNA